MIGCRTEHRSGAQKVQRHSNLQTTYNFGNVSKIMKNTSWTNLFTSEVQEIPNDGSSELAHSGGGQIHLTIIRAMMIKSGGEGRGGGGRRRRANWDCRTKTPCTQLLRFVFADEVRAGEMSTWLHDELRARLANRKCTHITISPLGRHCYGSVRFHTQSGINFWQRRAGFGEILVDAECLFGCIYEMLQQFAKCGLRHFPL